MANLTFDFTTPDLTFDRKSGRFRVASGAGKGQFISREAVLSQTQKYLDVERAALVKLGDRLSTKAISLRDFQFEAGESVRRIQVASAILGRGGRDRMTPKDWAQVQVQIKAQLYKGKDPTTGKRYGLKFLAKEWAAGTVSPAQLAHRLSLYGQSGIVTYHAMDKERQKDDGKVQGVRILSPKHVHCPPCVKYAAMPPQPIDDVVPIATRCDCRNNCKCSIQGLTLEEAIAYSRL
jgi:hypothetical protein